MKYIMYEIAFTDSPGDARRMPILFPDELNHRDVAKLLNPLMHELYPRRCTVVSAGTFAIEDAECKGGSESLGLRSHPRDTEIVLNYDTSKGF